MVGAAGAGTISLARFIHARTCACVCARARARTHHLPAPDALCSCRGFGQKLAQNHGWQKQWCLAEPDSTYTTYTGYIFLDCLPPVCVNGGLPAYDCSDGCATCTGPGAYDCSSCTDGSSTIEYNQDDNEDGLDGECCPGYCDVDDDDAGHWDGPAYDQYVYPCGFCPTLCPTPAPTMVPTPAPVTAISAATRTVHAFPFAALLAVLALAYI